MLKGDDEIKVLAEISVELQFRTHKLIEKLSQEKDSQEEASGKFNSTLENVIEKLIQEKYSPDDFYGFMYDTDDDASISDDPYDKTKDLFVELDQAKDVIIQDNVLQEVAGKVIFNPVVYELVAEEVVEMANDQVEALSDQEVADDSLDEEEVEEGR
ncbi:hypothetical protein Tco_1328176 [Tanacetum coccineum]